MLLDTGCEFIFCLTRELQIIFGCKFVLNITSVSYIFIDTFLGRGPSNPIGAFWNLAKKIWVLQPHFWILPIVYNFIETIFCKKKTLIIINDSLASFFLEISRISLSFNIHTHKKKSQCENTKCALKSFNYVVRLIDRSLYKYLISTICTRVHLCDEHTHALGSHFFSSLVAHSLEKYLFPFLNGVHPKKIFYM